MLQRQVLRIWTIGADDVPTARCESETYIRVGYVGITNLETLVDAASSLSATNSLTD